MGQERFKSRISRRDFFKLSGLGAAGLAMVAMPRWVRAASTLIKDFPKILIVLFQRGAADGLNMVAPFNDRYYHQSRPTIALNAPGRDKGVLDLDGRFGLHPALSSLMPMWKNGSFAVIHAAGSPDGSRSHFEAQDNMETGTPGVKITPDGWLNRTLGDSFPKARSPLTAVAISPRLPRILRGDYPVTSFPNLNAYRFSGGDTQASSFDQLYEGSIDRLLAGVGRETEESVNTLQKIIGNGPKNPEDAGFPKSAVGRSFFELSRVIKANVGLRIGFLDIGGWDHHANEGSTDGQLNGHLKELGDAIAAFYQTMGDQAGDILLVTMTEFGRTMQENGDRGTDHGHGSVMMLFGGKVKGGKVYGTWPGLAPEQLFEGRDLQVTTDFRQVHTEILAGHLGMTVPPNVFPGFTPGAPLGFLAAEGV
jgi:uncharacterized protein (DUF1501 family)